MSNQAGQAYAFMAMAPVIEDQEHDLRELLQSFTQQTSPFAALPQTHFARWVIIRDWVNSRAQPRRDHLGCPYLIFTSNLHGPIDGYLDALLETRQAQADLAAAVGDPSLTVHRAQPK